MRKRQTQDYELKRLKVLAARAELERIATELAEKRMKEQEEKKQEARAQDKLHAMGVCVVDNRWIKEADGISVCRRLSLHFRQATWDVNAHIANNILVYGLWALPAEDNHSAITVSKV